MTPGVIHRSVEALVEGPAGGQGGRVQPLDRLPSPLRDQVASRGGIVARHELFAAGLSRDQVRTITRASRVVVPGVYDLPHRPGDRSPLPLEQRCWAASLHCGAGAVVSGVAALVLLGADVPPPTRVEMLLPHGRRVEAPAWLAIARTRVLVTTTRRRGLPVLGVDDAVLRIAGSRDAAIRWVTLACQQRLTTAARLQIRLGELARHPRRALLTGLLDDIDSGSTTALELAFDREVLRAHGLPRGRGQLVVPETGHPADRGWPQARLLGELDGIAFHSGNDRYADLALDAQHLALGWATWRGGWPQCTSLACDTAARLRDILTSRGMEVAFHRCPRCPPGA